MCFRPSKSTALPSKFLAGHTRAHPAEILAAILCIFSTRKIADHFRADAARKPRDGTATAPRRHRDDTAKAAAAPPVKDSSGVFLFLPLLEPYSETLFGKKLPQQSTLIAQGLGFNGWFQGLDLSSGLMYWSLQSIHCGRGFHRVYSLRAMIPRGKHTAGGDSTGRTHCER